MNLSEDKYVKLIRWIEENFYPIKTTNYTINSYGIQWLFEISNDGFYVDNDCIKSAMVECGFIPSSTKDVNWYFNVSQNSPGLLNDPRRKRDSSR